MDFKNVSKSQFQFGKLKKYDKNYFCHVVYDDLEPLCIQTPVLVASSGVTKRKGRAFVDLEVPSEFSAFAKFIRDIDDSCVDRAHKNSEKWFQKSIELEDIKSAYQSIIAYDSPPTLHMVLTNSEEVFNHRGEKIPSSRIKAGSKVRGEMEFIGIWVTSNWIGGYWELKSLELIEPSGSASEDSKARESSASVRESSKGGDRESSVSSARDNSRDSSVRDSRAASVRDSTAARNRSKSEQDEIEQFKKKYSQIYPDENIADDSEPKRRPNASVRESGKAPVRESSKPVVSQMPSSSSSRRNDSQIARPSNSNASAKSESRPEPRSSEPRSSKAIVESKKKSKYSEDEYSDSDSRDYKSKSKKYRSPTPKKSSKRRYSYSESESDSEYSDYTDSDVDDRKREYYDGSYSDEDKKASYESDEEDPIDFNKLVYDPKKKQSKYSDDEEYEAVSPAEDEEDEDTKRVNL